MIVKTFELQKLNKTGEKCILLYGENEGFKNQVFNEKFLNNFENKLCLLSLRNTGMRISKYKT